MELSNKAAYLQGLVDGLGAPPGGADSAGFCEWRKPGVV